jgi:hypothetical protein
MSPRFLSPGHGGPGNAPHLFFVPAHRFVLPCRRRGDVRRHLDDVRVAEKKESVTLLSLDTFCAGRLAERDGPPSVSIWRRSRCEKVARLARIELAAPRLGVTRELYQVSVDRVLLSEVVRRLVRLCRTVRRLLAFRINRYQASIRDGTAMPDRVRSGE